MKNHRLTAWRRRPPCQDFAASVPATRGLIAAPWTPLASLCSVPGQRLVLLCGRALPSTAALPSSPVPVPTVGTGILCSISGDRT
jgi:hypothetical protein